MAPHSKGGVCLRRTLVATAALVGSVVPTPGASGQAWVAPARVGAVNLLFQNVDGTGHLLADGSEVEGYDSVSRGLLIEVEYAFTDRLSVTAAVPYLGAKYLGPEPSFSGLKLDDCHCWNSGWQDFSLTLRYNLIGGAWGLTPSVSYHAPTHDYPYFGEAVLGRNLDEYRIAVDVGRRLDALSSRLSVTGRYSYAFVEKVLDLSLDRSNAMIGVGYEVTPRFSASAQLYWQRTHGGLRSTEIVTDQQWQQYDRIVRDNSFHAGVSVSYSFDRLDIFGSYVEFVDGRDTHVGRAVTTGVSWPFEL